MALQPVIMKRIAFSSATIAPRGMAAPYACAHPYHPISAPVDSLTSFNLYFLHSQDFIVWSVHYNANNNVFHIV